MVVGYRLGPLTHAILKRLIRTPFITLFNIAAQAFIAPEFVQDECTGPEAGEGSGPARLDAKALRERPGRRTICGAGQDGPRRPRSFRWPPPMRYRRC